MYALIKMYCKNGLVFEFHDVVTDNTFLQFNSFVITVSWICTNAGVSYILCCYVISLKAIYEPVLTICEVVLGHNGCFGKIACLTTIMSTMFTISVQPVKHPQVKKQKVKPEDEAD